ncbi:hypothetical protein HGRIS_013081 [Hohenbuehelia grisea]|uniref:Uncharacterized protein n=1 Tax=Hohenbuehelia grisea TaxID=104357 RepID=A0ABR3IUL8_9AGAR
MADELDTPLSPLSSAPSNDSGSDDDFSTANTKLSFDPMRTPERKLTQRRQISLENGDSSPLRRSARLSTAVNITTEQVESLSGSDDEGLSADENDAADVEAVLGTPDRDQFVQSDEPSSVLASRIIRAHDNPSPPPNSTSLSASAARRRKSGILIDLFDEAAKPAHTLSQGFTAYEIPFDASSVSGPSTPLTLLDEDQPMRGLNAADTSQPDLITFTSFSNGVDDDQPGPSIPSLRDQSASDSERLSNQSETASATHAILPHSLIASPIPTRPLASISPNVSMDHIPTYALQSEPSDLLNDTAIKPSSLSSPLEQSEVSENDAAQLPASTPEMVDQIRRSTPPTLAMEPTSPNYSNVNGVLADMSEPLESAVPIADPPATPPAADISPEALPIPIITLAPPEENEADVPLVTPRRSTRPRRSVSPFGSPDRHTAAETLPSSPRRTSPRRRSVSPQVFQTAQAAESPRLPPRRSSPRRRSVSPRVFEAQIPDREPLASPGDSLQASPKRSSPRRRSVSPVVFGLQSSVFTPLPLQTDSRASPSPRSRARKRLEGLPDLPLDSSSGEGMGQDDDQIMASPLEEQSPKSKGKQRALTDDDESNISSFARQVGSLSPDSANVLSGLLSPSQPASILEPLAPKVDTTPEPPSTPERLTPFPVFRHLSTPSNLTFPVRLASPVRGTSPERSNVQRNNSTDIPPPTPARRIPIEQAVAQGHLSPQKAAQLKADGGKGLTAGPSRMPIINLPPMDSPARRVIKSGPIAPSTPSNGFLAARPTAASRARSTSIEAKSPAGVLSKSNGIASPAKAVGIRAERSGPAPPNSKLKALPFPLTPSKAVAKPTFGMREPSPAPTPQDSNESTSKSSMVQRTSRIPRITQKPYAKPTVSATRKQPVNASTSTTLRMVDLSKQVQPPKASPVKQFRIVQTKPSSNGVAAQSQMRNLTSSEADSSTLPATGVNNAPSPKRKRGADKVNAVAETQTSRRIVPMRRVVPPRAKSPVAPLLAQEQAPDKLNADATADVVTRETPADVPSQLDTAGDAREIDQHIDVVSDSFPPQEQHTTGLPPTASGAVSASSTQPIEETSEPAALADIIPDPTSEPPAEDDLPDGVRRTRRTSRKPTLPPVSSSATEPRPAQSRRKASGTASARSEPALGGMSAVALRALTSTNTTKNQAYLVAKLNVEVIHKNGARPESPMVKMKTVSQRQEEERNEMRLARAERRARRSGEPIPELSELSDAVSLADDDSEDEDEVPDSPSLRPRRHQLRARLPSSSDDERDRPPKRAKLDDEDLLDSREGPRRVKWDEVLFEATSIDKVKPGTRARPRDDVIRKGCLAPRAKALQLDTLGNLPETSSPLKNLVEEDITVKKYVYDDDEPVVEVVVKNTRSRSKKGKT